MAIRARIAEVFESVQGEGLYLGEKQIFVRFFGCNLACQYCDTHLDSYLEYEPEELLNEIVLYQEEHHFISFTGGEPLLQNDFLKEILKLTKGKGYRNYLETNGTLAGELQEAIENLDIVAMDLKLPSSTGMPSLLGLQRKFLKIASQKEVFLKAVICQDTKEQDLREGLALIKEINRGAILVLQPNSFEFDRTMEEKLENFKHICLGENVTTCIIPQMHKRMGLR